MSNPQKSLILFNKAVEMKRVGNFDEAVQLQLDSIIEYPDDPNIMENYYSLGKIFYLSGEPNNAFLCYLIYNRLCEMKNPPILRDYKAMLEGNSLLGQKLLLSFKNLANHLGQTLIIENEEIKREYSGEIEIYRKSLMAIDVSLDNVEQKRYDKYLDLIEEQGYKVIFQDFDKMIDNTQQVQNETFELMRHIMKLKRQSTIKNSELVNIPKPKKKSGCFITTAVCVSFNKSDSCYELSQFRSFRDTWLITQSDGQSLIEEYYRLAPIIVTAIDSKINAREIYYDIWHAYLQPCLKLIEAREFLACKKLYIEMVRKLQNRYIAR